MKPKISHEVQNKIHAEKTTPGDLRWVACECVNWRGNISCSVCDGRGKVLTMVRRPACG